MKTQVFHLPNILGRIQDVEVSEGDWNIDGAIKLWSYTLATEGKVLKAKEKVSIDDANKSVTFVIVDGDPPKEFTSFKIVMKMIPKADGKGIVTWASDYKKLNENVATSVSVLDEKFTREIADHLLSSCDRLSDGCPNNEPTCHDVCVCICVRFVE